MFFFKKKLPEPKPMPCNHKWKDFPWYGLYGKEGDRYFLTIKEPFVCVKCKKRIDKVLMRFSSDAEKERNKELERIKNEYPDKLLDVFVVEDMVLDEQMVDREYLKIIDQMDKMNGASSVLESEIMKLLKEA